MLAQYVKVQNANKNYKIKAMPDKFMNILLKYKINDTCCDTNNCVVLSNKMLKIIGVRNKNFMKIRCKTSKTDKERIVRIFYTGIDSSESLNLSDTFLHNFGIEKIEQNVHLIHIKNLRLKVATEVDISLISVHSGISTAVTDDILKQYFKTPKLLYRNDIIAIDIQIYGSEYYYTNKQVNETPTIYFKCNRIVLEHNENYDGPCICVSDQTCLKQSADVQCFLPRTLSNLVLVEKEKQGEILKMDVVLIDMCPFGLNFYAEEIEKAIVPFLDTKSS